jgi:P27 family predicted phage terminase small subunit
MPAALAKLHGNPGKRAVVLDEPEGRGGPLWAAPPWLDDEQRAQWAYALECAPLGLLTATDRELLAIWVVASVEYARAISEVRKLGQVVRSKEGVAFQNPFLGIANRQALIMMRAGNEMGFSPVSRAALGRISGEIHGATGAPAASSRLAQYLAQKPDRLDS